METSPEVKKIQVRHVEETSFGVLDSQREANAEAFPGDDLFRKMKKPTDIDLSSFSKSEQKQNTNTSKIFQKKEISKFKVHPEVINYIDNLILTEKLPLKTLRFDINESVSNEEVIKYILDSKILTQKHKDEILSLIGFKKSEELDFVTKPENTSINKDDLVNDLEKLRAEYVEELVPYLEKITRDKKVFLGLMSQFGEKREMPEKDLPKSLVSVKNEYFNVRKKYSKTFENFDALEDLSEVENMREAVLSHLSDSVKEKLNKSEKNFDKVIGDFSIALSFDLDLLPQTESTFDGLRVREDGFTPAVSLQNPSEDVSKKESSLEFDGRKIVVTGTTVDGQVVVKVFWGGVEIAKGSFTPKGPKVKINSEFKHGFLMADTKEEQALKFAEDTIKNFKIQ